MPAFERAPRGRLVDLGAEILDRVDAAVLVVDLDGVVLYANQYCAHLYGREPDELIGDQSARYSLEPVTHELRSEIGQKILAGKSWEGDFAVLRADDAIVEVHAVNSPVFDEAGQVTGVISLAFDVTSERASQQQLRQTVAMAQILRDVGQTLVEELDADRVMQTVTDAARRLTGATVGAFVRMGDNGEAFVVASLSGRAAVPGSESATRADAYSLLSALHEPKPSCIDDLADGHHDACMLDSVVAASTGPLRSCIVAPSRSRSGEVTGGLIVADPEPERFSMVDAQLVGEIADQAGIVLDIARLFHAAEHEIALRRRSEEVQRFLGETSALLSWSLDYPEGYRRLAKLCVPFVADLCLIDVADETGIRRRAAMHADPRQAELVELLETDFAPDPFGPHPAASVVRGGRSELATEVSDEFLRTTARSDKHYELVKALDFTSYMCVPLTARGRTLGALTLVSAGSGRRFGPQDLALAEELGRRAGLALDNARLFAERDHVARALQSSLLPPTLPAIPRVRLAGRYRAAGEGNEVGGDFYDVFQVGRNAWSLVLGDVSGKGPEAAAIAGLSRHTLRGLSMKQRTPRRLLASLHETLVNGEGQGEFCTVCCGLLQPHLQPERGARFTIACAGHPPPVIRRAHGSVELMTCTGPLLGVPLRNVSFRQQVVDLLPGDIVVMYTDGVTEAHHRGQELFGEERLMQIVASAGRDIDALADEVVDAVIAYGPSEPRDDIAVIVVQIEGIEST